MNSTIMIQESKDISVGDLVDRFEVMGLQQESQMSEEIEYEEVLEVIEKLKVCVLFGIEDNLRAQVWKTLLIPHRHQVTLKSRDALDYDNGKRLKAELGRMQRRRKELTASSMATIEMVVATWMLQNNRNFHHSYVYMCAPIVQTMQNEVDSYLAYEMFMKMYDEYFDQIRIDVRVSKLLALFRVMLPDLYNYFEEEEIDCRDTIKNWFSCFLAKELPVICVQRLWDCYLCQRDGFDMHSFVCLSILCRSRDSLEELENLEITSFLSYMPSLDIDQIIHNAVNIRHEIDVMNKY